MLHAARTQSVHPLPGVVLGGRTVGVGECGLLSEGVEHPGQHERVHRGGGQREDLVDRHDPPPQLRLRAPALPQAARPRSHESAGVSAHRML